MATADIAPVKWSATLMPPYQAGGHQPCPVITIWHGCNIFGQVPAIEWKRRIRWLPSWLPWNRYPVWSVEIAQEQLAYWQGRCEARNAMNVNNG